MHDDSRWRFRTCEKQEVGCFMRLVASLSETLFERGSVHMIAIDAYHVAHSYCSLSTRYLLIQVFTSINVWEKCICLASI